MKALIESSSYPQKISGWAYDSASKKFLEIWETIPDTSRVAQVSKESFEVAPPLFWVECGNSVVADEWYYDNATAAILPMPSPPALPVLGDQPTTTGSQTL
jgi:hypothetical protein